jgi:hypothetical protein
MKIKKWNLQKIVDVSSKLKTLNDIFFKYYKTHILKTKMIDIVLLLNFYSLWHRHKTIHAKIFTCFIQKKNLNEKKNLSFLILSRRKSSSTNRR